MNDIDIDLGDFTGVPDDQIHATIMAVLEQRGITGELAKGIADEITKQALQAKRTRFH
jgi:hypothetical protein